MKVIIKFNTKTSHYTLEGDVELYHVDSYEDAFEILNEAESQRFGKGIILTDQEFQTLVNQGTIDVPTTFLN